LKPLPALFPEEERSKQPSAFSILRTLVDEFRHPLASRLALVGAFGYDLLFQFDPIELKLPREGVKDLHLYLCDEIYFMDRKKSTSIAFSTSFARGDVSTEGAAEDGQSASSRLVHRRRRRIPRSFPITHPSSTWPASKRFAKVCAAAIITKWCCGRCFQAPYAGKASALFERIQHASPSPYEFLLQFGEEQLIGASPEMFVRVEGRRVETCPIAGTARRTGDPLRDADSIRELLNSTKEESELTMCSDVDRNDKSRVCVPGSVRVIARRLIESYAGLFHTVDHVEGTLADGFDSLDAFLSHMWAVTVIGAPKKWAAQAIENIERTARGWYGGAVGMISLDGEINTGITIRTVHLRDGVASYPAGATLLYDSVPEAEDRECWLKATGFFRALNVEQAGENQRRTASEDGRGVRMLLVDCEDCFIHTLANYARQTGAESDDISRRIFSRPDRTIAAVIAAVVARPRPPERFSFAGIGAACGEARSAHVRRVPGVAIDGRGVRRRARRARISDARETVAGAQSRRRCVRGIARGIPRRPLSFVVRDS